MNFFILCLCRHHGGLNLNPSLLGRNLATQAEVWAPRWNKVITVLFFFWSENIFFSLSAVSGDAPPEAAAAAHLLSAPSQRLKHIWCDAARFHCLFVLNVSCVAAGLHPAASLRWPCSPRRWEVLRTEDRVLAAFVCCRLSACSIFPHYLGEGYGPVQGQRGFPVTAQFLSGCLECIQQC